MILLAAAGCAECPQRGSGVVVPPPAGIPDNGTFMNANGLNRCRGEGIETEPGDDNRPVHDELAPPRRDMTVAGH
jgi:hypothetical protein